MNKSLPLLLLSFVAITSCNNQSSNTKENTTTTESGQSGNKTDKQAANYTEGTDYMLFERVRILDRMGFTEPQEAYSLLLPKGWQAESDIVWNMPGKSCDGTFKWLKAKSADGKYSLEMYPDLVFGWNTNQELMQFNQQNASSNSYCSFKEPMDAEPYLKNVFAGELGNPQIAKVEANPFVVEQMKQANEQTMNELRQYGAGQMQFFQTAVNANVKWSDNTEGMVVLGTSVLETVVPNVYNGSSDKLYTTLVTKRIVFKYPAGEAEQAKNQFALIMGSFRTNPAWNDAVNKLWKDVRQQRNVVHIGKIKLMDEQTRQMGEAAVRKGQERLNSMDADMRSWEAKQNSQDRMHTNFIKTIREVENYQDATGKVELSSGYNHAWSRGDGSSFVLSNNPNFDPAFAFKDQAWKEMKKVD